MFWKKKTNNRELIDYEFDTRRENFRLQSEAMGPAVAIYEDTLVEMVDISAGGISFINDNCSTGEIGTVQIELPGHIIESITMEVKIIHISNDEICHCCFTKNDAVNKEKIHQYILFRQIATLRKIKSLKGKTGC